MRSILLVLLLSLGTTSREKEDPVSTSPTTRQTDDPTIDPTDPDPTDLVVHSNNEQTVFMYLSWSNNLISFFHQNIVGLKSIIGNNILGNERVIIFVYTSATKATFSGFVYENGKGVQKILEDYDYSDPTYITAEGIVPILNDIQTYVPTKQYAMIIGCHGMEWIPVSRAVSRSSLQISKEHWEYEHAPVTCFPGGIQTEYQTDIITLAGSISNAGLKMGYILFDDCYMFMVEVACDLKNVTSHLIASTSETMAYGMPYDKIGQYLVGNIDYEKVCDGFYPSHSDYVIPCGTIGVTGCSGLNDLAAIMKEVSQRYTFNEELTGELQRLDGYTPTIPFDYGDYVSKLHSDPDLLEQFNEQLKRAVPLKRNIEQYFTVASSPCYGEKIDISTFSRIMIPNPSTNPGASKKNETMWYITTH